MGVFSWLFGDKAVDLTMNPSVQKAQLRNPEEAPNDRFKFSDEYMTELVRRGVEGAPKIKSVHIECLKVKGLEVRLRVTVKDERNVEINHLTLPALRQGETCHLMQFDKDFSIKVE